MGVRYSQWDVIEGDSQKVADLADELVHGAYLKQDTVDAQLNPVIKSEKFNGRVFVENDFARAIRVYERGEWVATNVIQEF